MKKAKKILSTFMCFILALTSVLPLFPAITVYAEDYTQIEVTEGGSENHLFTIGDEVLAKATVSVTDLQCIQLSTEIQPGASISASFTLPDGSTVEDVNEFQCIDEGLHICTVTCTKDNFEETVQFLYTAVAKPCHVFMILGQMVNSTNDPRIRYNIRNRNDIMLSSAADGKENSNFDRITYINTFNGVDYTDTEYMSNLNYKISKRGEESNLNGIAIPSEMNYPIAEAPIENVGLYYANFFNWYPISAFAGTNFTYGPTGDFTSYSDYGDCGYAGVLDRSEDWYGQRVTDRDGNLITDEPFLPLNGGNVFLHWREQVAEFKVEYNIDKNSYDDSPEDMKFTQYFIAGQQDPMLENAALEYEGYRFSGWVEKGTGTYIFKADRTRNVGNNVKKKWDIYRNVVLEPVYEPLTFTLYYSKNNEHETTRSKSVKYDSDYSLVGEVTPTEYEGLTFDGWYLDDGTKIFDKDGNNLLGPWKFTEDQYAYATYIPSSTKVNYYVENTEVEDKVDLTDTFDFNQENPTLSTAAKEYNGYTFEGWYLDNEKLFNADGTYVKDKWDQTQDITVVPKFTPNTYNLNYSLTKDGDVTDNTKQVTYNTAYGLDEADIANVEQINGFKFIGWYDGDTQIFDENGRNTDNGIWTYTHDINAKATYVEDSFTIYYNLDPSQEPIYEISVKSGDDYAIPAEEVSKVLERDGYTFDGWVMYSLDGLNDQMIFNADGTPVSTTGYDFDGDIYVYVTYHENVYHVRYNDTNVSDEVLDKLKDVYYGKAYDNIDPSPYKPGYVFQGHTLEDTDDYIWDYEGIRINEIWQFICGEDGAEVNAYKNYTPKTFTVIFGDDFDNDNVIDGPEYPVEITYGTNWKAPNMPETNAPAGISSKGYYTLDGTLIRPLRGVVPDEPWTYDDGKDWNVEDPEPIYVLRKWEPKVFYIAYNNTTIEDDNLDKRATVKYGEAYDGITSSPYKTGYIFDGHTLEDTGIIIWDGLGNPTEDIWKIEDGIEPSNKAATLNNAYKVYTPKTFTVKYGPDYDGDNQIDGMAETFTVTYDGEWQVPDSISIGHPISDPDVNPYVYEGWYLVEANETIIDEKGIASSNTWIWDDGKDWNLNAPTEFTLVEKAHKKQFIVNYNNTTIEDTTLNKQETVTYGDEYSDISKSPYKEGYIFQGHFLDKSEDKVWDGTGKTASDTWTLRNGKDGTEYNAYKQYIPKTFTVIFGDDFDNDNVIDGEEYPVEITYGENWTEPNMPTTGAPEGYRAKGLYTVDGKLVKSYNGSTVAPWNIDDGIDWNIQEPSPIYILRKWAAKEYAVEYNNTTVEDTNLDKTTYVTYGEEYEDIDQSPYKPGYVFKGHKLEDTDDLIWNGTGKTTSDIWDFTISGVDDTAYRTVRAFKEYTPKTFTINYGDDFNDDNVIDGEVKSFTVTYGEEWNRPSEGLIPVIEDDPYTYDGWFLVEKNIFIQSENGTKASNTWIWDDGKDWNNEDATEFTLVHKAHKKTYTVKYNDTDVSDVDRNKEIIVKWAEAYDDFNPSPYKPGYVFRGHRLDSTLAMFWDINGIHTADKFTPFTGAGSAYMKEDGGIYTASKIYYNKTLRVHFGYDYNNDNVWDETLLFPRIDKLNAFAGDMDWQYYAPYYPKPESMTFKNEIGSEVVIFDQEFGLPPVPEIPGVTLEGFYIVSDGYDNICIAKYNPETKELTAMSNTWIWDDGKDWNKDDFSQQVQVVAKFTKNEVPITLNIETDEKVTPGVGNKSDYVWSTKDTARTYDEEYEPEEVPTKRGYNFAGYVVSPVAEVEPLNIWAADGSSMEDTFIWLPVDDNETVMVWSQFEPKIIKGKTESNKYNPETDVTTPGTISWAIEYDSEYDALPAIPEKEGYTFNGIVDKDGNEIWDKDGNPVQEVWQYIDEDFNDFELKWVPKTYKLVYPDGDHVQEVTFDKAVPKLETMTKTGSTFSGYSFDYFGTTVNGFDKDGKFASSTWNYDMGPDGTKVYLKDLWNLNTYKMTIKPDVPGYTDYVVNVIYDQAYAKQTMPKKTGYFTKGYYEVGQTDKIYFFDKDGNPSKTAYPYDHDITVTSDWQAKTFYVHCGEQVIKVTYDSSVTEKANIPTKSGYTFKSWNLKDKPLFDKDGKFTATTWTIDAGDDGTHIYLDPVFEEVKKPADTPAQTPQPASNNNPVPAATPEQPHVQTGDATSVYPFILTMISFMTIAGAAILINKKKHK